MKSNSYLRISYKKSTICCFLCLVIIILILSISAETTLNSIFPNTPSNQVMTLLSLDDEDVEKALNQLLLLEYSIDEMRSFYEWSIEKKAAYSQRWKPIVDAVLAQKPDVITDSILLRSTRYSYGLPQSTDISEQQALEVAKKAIIEIGANEASLFSRTVHKYFDVTNDDNRMWKFTFTSAEYNNNESDSNRYRVCINAQSGLPSSVIKITNLQDQTEVFY